MRKAVNSDPICDGVALPDMMVRMASAASFSLKSCRSTSFWMQLFYWLSPPKMVFSTP